jgi:hypothetical protein
MSDATVLCVFLLYIIKIEYFFFVFIYIPDKKATSNKQQAKSKNQ